MLKIISSILIAALMLILAGCATKVLHCDKCNSEVKVQENSNMEEDWAIFCESCNEEIMAEMTDLNK